MGGKNVSDFVMIAVVLLIFLPGCELLELFEPRIDPSDPYDENCNLKPEYHDGGWKKYSDFDSRIPMQSRSPEAQAYYKAVDDIAKNSAMIYTLQRDTEIDNERRKALTDYRKALIEGHNKNILRAFMRMSFFTADTIFQNYYGAKGMMTNIMDPARNTVQMVGEGIKFIDSYDPDNSIISHNTKTIEGKVNDVARAGWEETIASFGNPKDVAQEMTKKSIRYAMGAPDPKLSKRELSILRQEHLEKKRLDAEIQKIDNENFKRMWEIRKLEQDVTYLESSLFDLEYDEKDRVDDMLIAECKRIKGDE